MSADDLIDFVESVSGDAHLAVEERLGDGFVRLQTAEAERRQAKPDIRCVEDVVIEMLRNARDAHATSIFLATSREGRMKTLAFLDDGDGIPIESASSTSLSSKPPSAPMSREASPSIRSSTSRMGAVLRS